MSESKMSRRDALLTGAASVLGLVSIPSPLDALRSGTDRVVGTTPARASLARGDAGISPAVAGGGRERIRFDTDWRFHLGHASDPARDFGYGADEEFAKSGELFAPVSHADFDVSSWRRLDLPHDWAVELPFVDEHGLTSYGFKPVGRAHPDTSIGWYRKSFAVPAEDLGRRISLEFDGVFRDCMVALNGHLVARNLSGYAPFAVDITPELNYGGDNVLVVRVDATEHEGWFYEGAGIYRHVWLVKTAPVHVALWGTFVRATVDGAKRSATAHITTTIQNDGDADARCAIELRMLDGAGQVVQTSRSDPVTIPAAGSSAVDHAMRIDAPSLWSLDAPHLYTLVTLLTVDQVEVDRTETPLGIRTVQFDPDRGVLVNGEHVEIRGTCNHQDHAGVGSALPDRLQAYRIERLKAMGANAYRTSHNPPAAELLDACDRIGMLVLDETRMFGADPEALSQLGRLVRRDRNHPCVFAWSLANEEDGEQGTDRGARMAEVMKATVRQLDPTRPVTAAMNGDWGKGFTGVIDVQGFNYRVGREMDAFRARFPRKPAMGTEVASTVSTRGIYANDTARGYVSAYDRNFPPWASTAEAWWTAYLARPWASGGFVWTGFDYRGEPTPYAWPCINSHFGIMDTCGFPKDNYYYYQAQWGSAPVLHVFPHWNWAGHEGQPIEVWCHTNLERVELFLNGARVGGGAERVPPNGHAAWHVPFAPGVLEARGYRGGRVVLTARRETAGAPAAVALEADRIRLTADGMDVSVVAARIVDARGRTVPTASNRVTFGVTGPLAVIGVGNGDPSSHESDKDTSRSAFNGLCCAIVQAGTERGPAKVTAAADGLRGSAIDVVVG
ncbi:MAG TPA: beta-galactosidase GalA [Candidatus Tumulicola sp.]|nr:beta-galactosidase GalA [Candidatus Tumulicola sp.]HSC30585.1 beta-galactosidase GalA [Gemmatimonadaceae bacterium]